MPENYVENLEKRVFLSATLGLDGTLTVAGGPSTAIDRIMITVDDIFNPHALVVSTDYDSFSSQFVISQVNTIVINAGDGDDTVSVDPSVLIPCLINLDATPFNNTGDGNDVCNSGGGDDTIICGNGNDAVGDTGGDDSILCGAGNDTVAAGSGNDFVNGEGDFDVIQGQDGNDSILGGAGNDNLDGGVGDDTIQGGAAPDTMEGGDGFDFVDYTDHTGTNRVWITLGDSTLDGSVNGTGVVTENDQINGTGFGDTFEGVLLPDNTGTQNIGSFGGIGNVVDATNKGLGVMIIGGSNNDGINGSNSNDTLVGMDNPDILNGNDGADILIGGAGNDQLNGGGGADRIFGDYDQADFAIIVTTYGNDAIAGGENNDSIFGDFGNDQESGGTGDDYFNQGTGPFFSLNTFQSDADTIAGNDGLDTVDYSQRTTAMRIDVDGINNDGDPNVQFNGGLGEADSITETTEKVIGTNFNDTLVSSNDFILDINAIPPLHAAHWFVGGKGNDSLGGNAGDDTLEGGDGNDTVDGGLGADSLLGGADSGGDTLDYSSRTGDVIASLNGIADDGEGGEGDNVFGFETVLGGIGNDQLIMTGATGKVSLVGGQGDDTLVGAAFNDTLLGQGGDDSLVGASGDDSLVGASGSDTYDGGTGFDAIDYSDATTPINVTFDGVADDGVAGENDNIFANIDQVTTGSGNDFISLVGVPGTHRIISGAGKDTVVGGAFNDYIDGGAGNDSLLGGDGDDTIYGQAGNDAILGQNGNDRLVGNTGVDTINGGDGNDVLVPGHGQHFLIGGNGRDTVSYYYEVSSVIASLDATPNDGPRGQHDDIRGDIENLEGGQGNDTLTGSGSSNVLTGGPGNDLLIGYNGNDTLRGGLGSDTLNGATGNDVLQGQGGADRLIGGKGIDTGDYSDRTENLFLSLDNLANDGALNEHDKIDYDVEILIGGSGNDSIAGGPSNETLIGGAGNDTIRGSIGNDSLIGGTGLDSLLGEAGNDTLKADDGLADFLNGGTGTDQVAKDNIDTVINVP
ncbi:MAG TPA: calcium-binding protein [Tepidisphaeraceae bacterium]|nr:calcium-binding protein [Tepidisphaeraceae bacterium]